MAELGDGLSWAWDMIVLGTSFQHWPDGDPEQLRALGEQWQQLSDAIYQAYEQMGQDASQVAQNWGGDAGTAFISRWQQFVGSDAGGPNEFLTAAAQYAQASQNAALQLEFAQLMCIIIVGITAAEIMIGIAFSEFGGELFAAGALAAGRAALMVVLRTLSAQMSKQILKTALKDAAKLAAERATKISLKAAAKDLALGSLKSGLRAGVTFGGADAMAQGIQIAEGHRNGFDLGQAGLDFAGGAAAGVAGHLAGAGVGVISSRAAKRAEPVTDKLLGRITNRQAAAVTAGLGRLGRASLVGGVVNLPSMAALNITQNTLRTGDLWGSATSYLGHLSWSELGDEFVAGMFGGGFRHGVELAAHPLVSAGGRALRLTGTADAWRAHADAITTGRESSLPQVASLRAEAGGLRELQAVALERAASHPPGLERNAALEQATTYGQGADRVSVAAGESRSPAMDVTRTSAEPARAQPRSDAPLTSAVSAQVLEVRTSHVAYVRAETTAGISDLALHEARQVRASGQVADLSRQLGLPESPAHGSGTEAESLSVHSALWHDLATTERTGLVRKLDAVLGRSDLPADVRTELTHVREGYQAEGEARIAGVTHGQQAEQLMDQAWRHARAGEPEPAMAAARAAADQVNLAQQQRVSAHRALLGSETAFRALPEPVGARAGIPSAHHPALGSDSSPAPSGVGPSDPARPSRPDRDPGPAPQEQRIDVRHPVERLPGGEIKIVGFADRLGTPGTPDLLGRLAGGLARGGDAVALRVPGDSPGRGEPGVGVLGADRIPGVTGEISSLLRLDGLPGGADVLAGNHRTAGVADRLRDYAYPGAKLVQVADRLPRLADGSVDPEYLAVLGRADLVVGTGPELTGQVAELMHGTGPLVREVAPVFQARPAPGPAGDGFHVVLHDGSLSDGLHAARVITELHARGIDDVRLTMTTSTLGERARADIADRLSQMVGARVDVVPAASDRGGAPERLASADLVLLPERSGGDDRGLDPGFVAAVEHGVPVLAGPGGDTARFLRDPARTPAEVAGGWVVDDVAGNTAPGDTVFGDRGRADARAWADRVQDVHADPARARARAEALRDELAALYPAERAARDLQEALLSIGDGGLRDPSSRVGNDTWRTPLNPREVVLRHAAPEPGDGLHAAQRRPVIMTTNTEYWSPKGGVPTANRELTEAFGAAGADAVSLVSIVDPSRPGLMRAEPAAGVQVVGAEPVWGVRDRTGGPDVRALFVLPEGVPRDVDAIVGHSRFSGGGAHWLAEHVYPDAKYVHILHTSPEVLDALKGDPEGLVHAATERTLMADADLVAGVGPLLGADATRLATEGTAAGGIVPRVHTIIPDLPAREGNPPPRPAERMGYELLVQGRADDVIKGVKFGARLAGELASPEAPVRLVVRGAAEGTADRQREALFEAVGGRRPGLEIEVREYSMNADELLGDVYGADLVLMPSVHEGFGLAAAEAVRAGKPVLVGEGAGAGQFLGDPGFVPGELGEPMVVRDGNTLESLRAALSRVTRPDGSIDVAAVTRLREGIDDARLEPWVRQARAALTQPDPDGALRLRDWLAANHPSGSAARGLLDALGWPAPQLRTVDEAVATAIRGPLWATPARRVLFGAR